ncbi:hypothetical protein J2Y48_002483 [Mycoplana sp. BE70]|uniref:hypothetical protein n=1 Tax=Mycoplana sp. BE70 TaxID=2817775 RepID=UPI00285D4519|nr:hypothetical protein [Mycoplana sp. BE70]MDR6757187.1 hypothetical protein [Mycoplana sp. BE70]
MSDNEKLIEAINYAADRIEAAVKALYAANAYWKNQTPMRLDQAQQLYCNCDVCHDSRH